MLFNRKPLGVLFLSALAIGCSKELNKAPDNQLPVTPTVVVKQPEVITYVVSEPVFAITGDSEPHTYQVQIKWPKNPNPIQILVDGLVLARILPTESNLFTFKVQDRRTYVIEIQEENQEQAKLLDSRKLEIPIDYIFSSTEVLTKDSVTKANRIFFKKTALIETGKFNFTLEADEIFFEEGAHIINFTTLPRVGVRQRFVRKHAIGAVRHKMAAIIS